MKLRLKLIIILSVLVGALILTLYAFSYTAVFDRYSLLEQKEVTQEITRVGRMVDTEVARIDSVNWDWASWDDTYRFASDHNQAYIDSNLDDSAFSANRINMILLYDTSGNLVGGMAYNLTAAAQVEIPATFRANINGLNIGTAGVDDHFSGIISTPEGLLMFSARPVLTSEGLGPPRGTLVMCRYIDVEEVGRLRELMGVDIGVGQLSGGALPADYQSALKSITVQNPVASVPVTSDEINGYMVLNDYMGQPALAIRITLPREIYQEGQAAVQSFLLYFLMIGLGVGVIGMVVNDQLFVKPIVSLSRKVDEIGRKQDFEERLEVRGDDEQASLRRDINGMLDSLKEAREKELAQRTAVEDMRREHFRELLSGASRVVNTIRYDLRSPLQVIKNATYLLREDPKRADALADMIDESVESAVSTIEDLSSKTQTGEMKITVTDLRYVIEMAIDIAKLPKNIGVVTDFGDEFLAILLDVAKFQRVLESLIRNAVEAMPDGGTLTIRTRRVSNDIQIEIEDTGMGIEPENMGKLFQPFYTTKPAGSGLGLVSSKAIVEALGGKIWIDSTPGRGTRVTLTLPIKKN